MSYIPRRPLRAHQQKARDLTRGKRLFAYLCEMGTGKTAMVLTEWAERVDEGTCHDLLVIAPAGSYRNWAVDKGEEPELWSELRKNLPETLFRAVSSYVWQSGMGVTARKRLGLFLALRDRPRVLVINVEALSRKGSEAFEVCREFLSVPGRKSMAVIDESTVVKNDGANRTQEVLKLRPFADLRRIMTGLVAPKAPTDLYSQFAFLDWRILGHQSFYSFRNRYCVLENIKTLGKDRKGDPIWKDTKIIVGYKNVEELQKKIAPYSYRVLKEECLDLPEKIYMTPREVALTAEQRRAYDELVAFSTAELDNKAHVTTNMVMVKLLRLHQIVCGHVTDEEGNFHNIKSHRIEEMMETIEEHNGKVIIWSCYRPEIEKIVAALEKEYGKGCTAQFHGGNTRTRGEDERRFLSDWNCRFMIATQSAGGRGNTWVNASLNIYYANDYDLEKRLQSEDRSHRDGLRHPVTYVDLQAPQTVDEKIIKALRKKLDMATLINGDNYRSWLI